MCNRVKWTLVDHLTYVTAVPRSNTDVFSEKKEVNRREEINQRKGMFPGKKSERFVTVNRVNLLIKLRQTTHRNPQCPSVVSTIF